MSLKDIDKQNCNQSTKHLLEKIIDSIDAVIKKTEDEKRMIELVEVTKKNVTKCHQLKNVTKKLVFISKKNQNVLFV